MGKLEVNDTSSPTLDRGVYPNMMEKASHPCGLEFAERSRQSKQIDGLCNSREVDTKLPSLLAGRPPTGKVDSTHPGFQHWQQRDLVENEKVKWKKSGRPHLEAAAKMSLTARGFAGDASFQATSLTNSSASTGTSRTLNDETSRFRTAYDDLCAGHRSPGATSTLSSTLGSSLNSTLSSVHPHRAAASQMLKRPSGAPAGFMFATKWEGRLTIDHPIRE